MLSDKTVPLALHLITLLPENTSLSRCVGSISEWCKQVPKQHTRLKKFHFSLFHEEDQCCKFFTLDLSIYFVLNISITAWVFLSKIHVPLHSYSRQWQKYCQWPQQQQHRRKFIEFHGSPDTLFTVWLREPLEDSTIPLQERWWKL